MPSSLPLLLALSVPLAACAEPAISTTEQPIVGGTVTPAGMYPGVGELVVGDATSGYFHGCTGTLIAPDVVLTAAHCVADLDGIIPGFTLSHDVDADPVVVRGRAVVAHEDYVDEDPIDFLDEFHDIGLLLLAEPIRDVEPVALIRADQSSSLVAELALQIVGYGRTGDGVFDEGVKRHATTVLVELNATEMQVSRGGSDPQNCLGDSGGPSLVDLGAGLQQVGVVSRSHAADDCRNGGIHTRVDAYLDWIAANSPAPDDGGGCSTSSGQGSGAALLGLLLVVGLRRRTARRAIIRR